MKAIPNSIEIKEGMTIVCDTLSWDDGWEFDHPSMLISPIVLCHETGKNHEQIVEDFLIDAVTAKSGKLAGDDFEAWSWRGYKLPVLRRRFREALAGKNFPKAGYLATRETVKIIRDKRGELTWETI